MQLERERMKLERELQTERERARKEEEAHRQQLKEQEIRVREAPRMAPMKEHTDAELYLNDFEDQLTELRIPKERWMVHLRPLLADWARDVTAALPEGQKADYEQVKEKILHFFGLRRGSLGSRFWNFSRPKDSTFNNGFLTARECGVTGHTMSIQWSKQET